MDAQTLFFIAGAFGLAWWFSAAPALDPSTAARLEADTTQELSDRFADL